MSRLEGFSEFQFIADNTTYPVFCRGSGAAVVIMHELPGMIPECVELAERIANQGFTVFLPLLFGEPNQPFSLLTTARFAAQICLSREFYCFATKQSSPITVWLRALCREAKSRCDGAGVGVIGMCLTGGFVLSMMADDSVLAPVACQPSLPFAITKAQKSALGISDEDLAQAKLRCENGTRILALRFSEDKTCPAERFARLRQEFGNAIDTIEIDSSPNNAAGISRIAHATLTLHFVDRANHPTYIAFERVVDFLKANLS